MKIDQLASQLKNGLLKDEPMSLHTSWLVGGPADYFVSPVGPNELALIIKFCREVDLPFFILGNGSNLLVLDGGIRGLVIEIGESFAYVEQNESTLTAGAGASMTHLARTAATAGLGGLEFAAGIPGTLGGALIMNAGAFGGYIGDKVLQVTVINPDGEKRTLQRSELVFGYRSSNLAEAGIIIEAAFDLALTDSAEALQRVNYFIAERRRRHPQLPSCGSVFRNLQNQPAGKVIEQAGGKGMTVGDAQVSEKHANFIVNNGDATAADILALIRSVQDLVSNKYDIELQPEVRIVGEERKL